MTREKILIRIKYSWVALLILFPVIQTQPFAYIFAAGNGVNLITHPIGYAGTGGTLTVSVGIDSTSANKIEMQVAVQNVVIIFNALNSTSSNLDASGVDPSELDFESVLLHELGHSLGLAHCNLGVQTGVSGVNTDYSNTTDGPDNTFDFDDGVDNIIGTADDVRDDDENINWFRRSNNDPFSLAGTVDTSTYSRLLVDLPSTDSFSANGARAVATALGYTSLEAVMQQGTFYGETQRTLSADDVAGITLAANGLDEIAGNSDDYTLSLDYLGLTDAADILIDFDSTQTGLAVSVSSGGLFNTRHAVITDNDIYFSNSTSLNWYFNSALLATSKTTLKGEWIDDSPLVTWTSTAKENFIVERSPNAVDWTDISIVSRYTPVQEGHFAYEFVDNSTNIEDKKYFYRVRLEGERALSNIIHLVKEEKLNYQVRVYPNPASSYVYLDIHSTEDEVLRLKVVSVNGTVVYNELVPIFSGQNTHLLEDLSKYSSGLYYIQLEKRTTKIYDKPIILGF